MNGWIKLYRKFCEWEWFNISEMVHLFIYLLLNANHEDGKWRGVEIKRGQILTGLNSLHEKTKISNQTLRTCLKRLEDTKEINTQVTNKYRIITICNYESYQNIENETNKQPNKQLTSKQQSTNKQVTTNNKNNNNKEEKECKEITMPFDSENFKEAWEYWKKYKKEEFRFNYKSEISEQGSLTELDNLSGHNEQKAIDIIKQSIKKGWKGFFQLDNSKGNNLISDSYKQELIERTKGINLNPQ